MDITVNGVRLWYEDRGEGRPLLLVHGNGESSEIFDRVIPALAEHFRVIAVDSRCHGRSQDPAAITYDLMARDLIDLIRTLGLHRPIFYGFSDGGIVGLLIAMKEPELLGKLIVSGANLNPGGLRWITRLGIRLEHMRYPSKLTGLMLREPDISPEALGKIQVPTVVLAGSRDVVKPGHTRLIARSIPGSTLRILPGEGHGSYIIHSPKLYDILKPYL